VAPKSFKRGNAEIRSRECPEIEKGLLFCLTAPNDRLKAAFFLCNTRSHEFKFRPCRSVFSWRARDIDVNKTRNLAISLGLLIVLIAAAPVLAITRGWLGPQLLTLAVVVMLLLLPSVPDTDVRRSLAIFTPLAATGLLPAAWMLLQIFPVPLGTIEHPIWRSAAAALAEPLSGHFSIDLGYTVRGLFGYLTLISLTFLTSVLTRNRERAETILFALCAITTFSAIELILLRGFAAVKPGNSPNDFADSIVALAAFGTILNVAFVVRAVERYETRVQREPQPLRSYGAVMLLGATGAAICLISLIYSTTYDVLIATAFGLVVVGLVVLIRRLSLGRWTVAIVCAAAFVACGGVIALRFAANPSVSPLFRFSKIESAEADAATLRMISDANWAGSGVGSYPALAAIYRDAAGTPGDAAINTMTSMVLEWGRVGLLIVTVLLLELLVVLFRGALSRGRDSFYAASAAACLVTAFCEAYCDTSLTDATIQMFTAIMIGLGLSQTIGRSAT
jgi:hypothetical protein